jgi:hypothetical protein
VTVEISPRFFPNPDSLLVPFGSLGIPVQWDAVCENWPELLAEDDPECPLVIAGRRPRIERCGVFLLDTV